MKHRRNAVLWAIGWWIVRREVRRRAAGALADVGASAAAQRGRVRAVLGAVVLVGLLAAAFVAARKLLSSGELSEAPPVPDAPPAPNTPIEPIPGTAPA